MTSQRMEHTATFYRHSPTNRLENDTDDPYHGLTDLNMHRLSKGLPARDDL